MYKRLSYPLGKNAPGFPNSYTIDIEQSTSISKGDAYNSAIIHVFNHFGSHFDSSKHFNDKGPTITDLPLERFVYEKPLLVDIPKGFRELIEADDLKPYGAQIEQADALFIRTGNGAYRFTDSKRYSEEGVAFSNEAAKYLVTNFKNLKAVGFDFISLGSPVHGDLIVSAHRHILGNFTDNFIGVIEDIDLSDLDAAKLKKVICLPLFITGIDGAPVSVLAEIND